MLIEVTLGGSRLPGDGLALVVQEGSGLLLAQRRHDLKHPLHALQRVNHPLVVDTRTCKQESHGDDPNSFLHAATFTSTLLNLCSFVAL